jgi:hypothetical protein
MITILGLLIMSVALGAAWGMLLCLTKEKRPRPPIHGPGRVGDQRRRRPRDGRTE